MVESPHCVLMERIQAVGSPEWWLEIVEAPSEDRAVSRAIEQAELRGRRARAVMVLTGSRVIGQCRDCGETVFSGGRARVRMNDVRCWGCGGGP